MAKSPNKKCAACKQVLPANRFWTARAAPDGLYSYCITCGREKTRKPAPEVCDLEGEEWRPVKGWDGLYHVSNLGRVKVAERQIPFTNRWGETSIQRRPARILKPQPTSFGHLTVGFAQKGRKTKRVLVHRLVCEAFHGPCPPDKQHCAHWDGDPTNNRADNLRWATVKENSDDTRRHGNLLVGEASNLSRLTEDEVLEIREKSAAGQSGYSLAKEYGLSATGIYKILNRENWKHI